MVWKKYFGQIVYAVTVLACCFLWAGIEVSGSETDETGIRKTNFYYTLDFPENQLEEGSGFYKLKMTPGQEQTLTGTLYNDGSEAITVNIAINGAKTNANGVISYGPSHLENDVSLPFAFEEIVTGPEQVEIAANSSVPLELQIKMPETSFDGILVGGFELKEADQGSSNSNGGGSRIINEYAYVTAIVLRETETEVKAEMQYRETYAGQENLRNAVMLKFANINAAYADDMSIETQVMAQGSEEILFERKQTGMRMAPNTYIDFPISMNGEAMREGDYTIHALVKVGGQSWEWTEDFEITPEEVAKYNERDAGLVQERGLDIKLIAIIVGGVLGVVLLAVLVKQGRARSQRQSKKQSRGELKRRT